MKDKGRCSECGEPLHYPFLHWNSILLCASCCQKIKRGFIADLIHVTAIKELMDIGYRDENLVRKQIKDVEGKALRDLVQAAGRKP